MGTKRKRSASLGLTEPFHRNFAEYSNLRGFFTPKNRILKIHLPVMQLPFVPVGKHRAFPISGDSMEPLVKSGSYVVGRFIESVNELKQGQTYIVVTKEGMVYKRLDISKLKEQLF